MDTFLLILIILAAISIILNLHSAITSPFRNETSPSIIDRLNRVYVEFSNYLSKNLFTVVSLIFISFIAYKIYEYVGSPEKPVNSTFSNRLEDARNIGLAIGGLVGAIVLIWRAQSHDTQARSARYQMQSNRFDLLHKEEEFNRNLLASSLNELTSDKGSSINALIGLESIIKFFRNRCSEGYDITTFKRIIDFLVRKMQEWFEKGKYDEDLFLLMEIIFSFSNDYYRLYKRRITIRDRDFLGLSYELPKIHGAALENCKFENLITSDTVITECSVESLTAKRCRLDNCQIINLNNRYTERADIFGMNEVFNSKLSNVSVDYSEFNNCEIINLSVPYPYYFLFFKYCHISNTNGFSIKNSIFKNCIIKNPDE